MSLGKSGSNKAFWIVLSLRLHFIFYGRQNDATRDDTRDSIGSQTPETYNGGLFYKGNPIDNLSSL